MRLLSIALAVCMLLGASKLAAQAIVVRSGEHSDFTRLVMRLPDNVSWQIDTEGNLSRLSLTGFDQGFDLSNAFTIIPRSRLQALVARDSELELQLGCNCQVNGFLEDGIYLVLDISENGVESETPQLAENTAQIPESPFLFGELLWGEEYSQKPENDAGTDQNAVATTFENPLEVSTIEIAEETRLRLTEAYSRAASIGLVNPRDAGVQEAISVAEPTTESEIFDASAQQVPETTSLGDNIRVTTSKDVPNRSTVEPIGLLGGTCPDPSRVAVYRWATDEDFSVQIARSNSALFDDAGRLVTSEVVKRAQLYIHFGFGAEASQVLALIPDLSSTHPELTDMSQVMEHGSMTNPRMLHRYADCNSDYALWGILSATELSDSTAIDTQAALRGLEKLPGHLKSFLGQEISARLIQRGDLENAMVAIRSFERVPETADTPKLVIAKAEELKTNSAAAESILTEIVARDTPETPAAIIEIVDKHVNDGTRVPAEIALLAETYLFELRGTPSEAEMYQTHLRASAKSNQFQKAFRALKSPPAQFDEYDLGALFNFVSFEATKYADDIEFLELYYDEILRFEDRLDNSTRVALAKKLMSLGFYDAATAALGDAFDNPETEDARLAAAELRIYSGEYAISLATLGNLEDNTALALRARAEKALGLYSDSAETFKDADQSESAVTAAWLSENWSDEIDLEDPTFGPARRVFDADVRSVEVNDDMLAVSQTAIEASGMAREDLSRLLKNLELSE